MIKYIKPYKVSVIIGSLAKLVEAFLELYLPLLMGRILDIAIVTGDKALIMKIGFQMLLFVLLGFVCATICQYSAATASQGTGTEIRNAFMSKVTNLSFSQLDELGTSTLINRINSDTNNVQTAVAMAIRLVTRAPFICIGAVVMSLKIHPQLALVFIGLIPIVGVVMYIFTRLTSPLYTESQKALDVFTKKIRESLSGIRVIRAFANQDDEEVQIKDAANEVKDAEIKVNAISSWLEPTSSIILNTSILLVLYFGARYVFQGQVTQGNILALTIYATKILYALGVIANLIVIFTKAVSSRERLLEVLDYPIQELFSANLVKIDNVAEVALSVENITFGYSERHPILSEISFSLSKGNTLGIVGVTGSSKTTLLQLLQRHYPISQGEIILMGNSIKDYTPEQLVEIYGIVPQANTLFTGTIKENIRMYAPSATDEELKRSLQTAQCWDFVSDMENSWNTEIYEGGKNFSGGQRQRLTIARALASNPTILLLDDSLSALDYKTDLLLRQALEKHYPQLTKIIVSQRISSVVNADHILILENGKSVGYGSHVDLLKSSFEYQKLYFSQQEQGDIHEEN